MPGAIAALRRATARGWQVFVVTNQSGIARGYFVRPTIFSRVTPAMTIAREEIFGPVLSIIAYQDEDDAVRIANDTPYGLSGYVSSADPARAQRIYGGYCRLMGEDGRQLLRRCFLSGEPDKELRLLRFLHVAFAEGPRAMALLGHADVAPVYAMAKAIGSETEKLMGFVRFEEADGMLGAVIHPKNQVLPLLAGHFWSRYPNEKFLIYDAVHQTALFSGGDGRRPEILRLTAPLTLPQADEKERYCQALWKRFYDTLAIETRRNEALRRSHCPKRYWADMTELREER